MSNLRKQIQKEVQNVMDYDERKLKKIIRQIK